MGTIKLHQRREVEIDKDEPKAKAVAKDIFWSKNHSTTLPNTEQITSTATWATFSPQTSKRIYADMELFRQCDADNLWSQISSCKQAVLFRAGDVVKTAGQYYLALGHIQFTMLLVWARERVDVGKTNHSAFLLRVTLTSTS